MRKFYFEESARFYGMTTMKKFEVKVVACDDNDEVLEVIETVQSNCCSDLFDELKEDKRVQEVLAKHTRRGGILCVTCIS